MGAGGGGYGAEYDVPVCAEGVPGCSNADPDWPGTWVHTITGTFPGSGRPVVAHMHCHAPTCLEMSLYNNRTGALICRERAVYGGTGHTPDRPSMDEPGFIAVPPCVWGAKADGFEEPPQLTGLTVTVVKKCNGTYGHHGEMAHGQIYYVSE